jgi:signal transduction histidine kinase
MEAEEERLSREKQTAAGENSAGGRAEPAPAPLCAEGNLLEALLQPVYIADVDTHEMLYMNGACKKLLGCRDYRGRKCYEVTQGFDAPCAFCTNTKLEKGKPYSWEHFNEMLGRTYQLQDNLIDYRGHRARIELVFDVSVHVNKEQELQTVLDAERQLVRAIQTVSGAGEIDERLNAGLGEMCGAYFEADRAYIFRISEKGGLDNLYEWCRAGVEPQIERLQQVDLHYMDRWLPYFEWQQAVVTPDIEAIRDSRPDEYRIMTMQGIRSFLEAPLFSKGKLIGFLGVDNPDASKSQHSADVLLSFAYSVGSALVQAQNERRIRQQYEELEAIVNNIPVGVSMIRMRDGKPVKKRENPLLRRLYDVSEEESGDFDVIAMSRLSDADRAVLQEKMRSLLTPGTEVSQTFRYQSRSGEPPRWYHMLARSAAVGDEVLLFSCLLDKTGEQEAEARSARSRKIYEVAAELARLKVWVYDVQKHRITLSDNAATARDAEIFGLPPVLENVPECLLAYMEPSEEKTMRDMYRALDEGVSDYECEYHYRVRPGVPDRWERVRYTMTYDENGRPELAYAIGRDVTAERQERERYRQAIRTLMASNPDTIGSCRLNLTRNAFLGGDAAADRIARSLPAHTADAFFEHVAGHIADSGTRARYREKFSRGALLAAAKNGETNLTAEYQVQREDGEQLWVKASFALIRNPDTGDTECVTFASDITKQKLDAAVFDRLTEREYDYIALLHMKTNQIEFLKVNASLAPVYRDAIGTPGKLYDFDAIRAFTASTWVDEADREFYRNNSAVPVVRERLDRDGHLEMNLRGHTAAHPERTMCRKIQHYDLSSKKDLVLIVQTDITEAYQRQLRETERAKTEAQRVEDIIDSVATGICVLRMPDAGHLEGEFVNLQMFRILGLNPPDGADARAAMLRDPMIGAYMKDAFLAVHPDDCERVKKAFREGYRTSQFEVGSYRLVRKDGSTVWVSQNAILRETRPDCRVFYASYRVADREVELQAELERQLEKEKQLRDQADAANAAKSDFLSRMSHDIRTPLNGIIGMTYLTKEMELAPAVRKNLDKIDTSSRFLLSLINDVLDMSKAESGKIELHPEPYDSAVFRSYLDSVVAPLCREKGIRFVVEVSPVPGVVPMLDTLRINQVLFNLLSNAVKFTPEGGTVTCRLRERLAENGRLAIEGEVSDTGIGMSEPFQKQLFEPFTQEMRNDNSETRGTGLGLAIVKKLLDLMGCEITVQSEMGRGTTFRLHGEFDCVPAALLAGRRTQAEPEEGTAGLAGLHVLLCEDHPLNREIAKTLLNEEHVLVSIAEDGQQGVREFASSAIGFYDAILMDVRMPVMDGLEATRRIRGLDRADAGSVPIIAMTADAFEDDIHRCLDAGMTGHVAKPIDPKTLFEVLRETVRRARPAGETEK